MIEEIRAFILGVIQGLTEFLPVSSSAHLNLFPWIMNWEITPAFDVALHIGTLLAMVVFFFKDWISLLCGGYRYVVKKEKENVNGQIFWKLVAATIPAAVLSLVLDKISEKIVGDNLNTEMFIIAITLMVMGVVLYIADIKGKNEIDYENISWKNSILIGVSQALAAAFPGVSRSGITMTTARFLGVKRSDGAKFSFMLAMPITLAAVIFDLDQFAKIEVLPFIIGVVTSFIVGMLVIKFLLDFLKKGSFKVFGVYRVIIGIVVMVIYFTR